MKLLINSKLCYIETDDIELLKRIDLLLSFPVKGAFFSQLYRSGKWDGREHLFNKKNKSFYIGLLYRVIMFLQSEKIEHEIVDNRNIKQNFKLEYLDKDRVLYKDGKKEIRSRYYSIDAINNFITNKFGLPNTRGIFVCPPRSGKTLIAGTLGLVLNEYPILFIVHKIDLAYQTKKVFEKLFKQKIGLVGDGHCDINANIVIITIQSICSIYNIKEKFDEKEKDIENKKEVQTFIESVKVAVGDECFLQNTKVLINENEYATIKEIYNNKNITEVLSYNEKTKQLEQKKIVRKILLNKKARIYRIKVKINNKIKVLKCTYNHKIWTDKGYIQAQHLKKGDIVKYLENFDTAKKVYICNECSKKFNNGHALGGHIAIHHSNREGYCKECKKSFKSLPNHLAYHINPLLRKEISKNINYEQVVETREKNPDYWKASKEMGLRRLGKNNPVFNNLDTIEKIRKSCKKTFSKKSKKEQVEQIVRFMNAPKYKKAMNKPETIINNLGFKELKYTGDGKIKKYIYKIKDYKQKNEFRNKIPDFIIKNQKKVIEIADRVYWHSEKEMNLLKKYYKEIGIKCLVIYADEIKKNIDKVYNKIYTFINNHDVEILECKLTATPGEHLYNLEVEDNHNFFADGFLVSNCHVSASSVWQELQKYLKSVIYGVGLSGTPYREDNAELKIEQLWGNIVFELTREEAVKNKFLLPLKIYFIYMPKVGVSAQDYQTQKREGINENIHIHDAVQKLIKRHKKKNMSSVVIIKEKAQGKFIHKKINGDYLHGGVKGEVRSDTYDNLNRKRIHHILSTVTDIGVDIPTLDSVIIASPSKSKVSAMQRLRSGTPAEGKEFGYVFVLCPQLMDNVEKKYLEEHVTTLWNIYKKESTFQLYEMKYEDL